MSTRLRSLFLVAVLALLMPLVSLAETPEPGGAESPEAVAKAFVAAMAERDLDRVKQLMVGPSLCEVAPSPEEQAGCAEYVAALHAQLPSVFDDYPEGFEAGAATRVEDEELPPALIMMEVASATDPDASALPVMVMEIEGRFYVGFAVRKEPEHRKPDPDRKK